MKSPDLSRNAFFGFPILDSSISTAHSGPELVRSIPQSHLARELAQALLTDHVQLTQDTVYSVSGGSFPSVSIGLARR